MDVSSFAKRDAIAQQRLLTAVTVLSERFGLGEQSLTVQAKDPLVKAMIQREKLADMLETLVVATEPKPKPSKAAA